MCRFGVETQSEFVDGQMDWSLGHASILTETMSRALSQAVEAQKNAQRFSYYDCAYIHLPFGPGDVTPLVLRVATAEIEVLPTLDFGEFTYKAFTGVFGRPPTTEERATWLDALITALNVGIAELQTAAADLIDALFADSIYTDRMRNDDQFVTDLYASYLGRPADKGKAGWVEQITIHDRATVQTAFRVSGEFIDRISLLSEPTGHDNDVREMGDQSFSDGAAIDGVQFSLTNAENRYSDILGQPGRQLYPAPATVKRAFRLPDGTFEAVVMLEGFAQFGDVGADDASVTINADTTPDLTDVVQEITQHCTNIYKGDGCDSPDTSPTCSHLKNDLVNGCATKAAAPQLVDITPPDNRPSFKGVAQPLASTTPAGVGLDPDGVGPDGWPGDEYDPNNPHRRGRSYQFGL